MFFIVALNKKYSSRFILAIFLSITAIVLSAGCGPIGSTQRISDAEAALERARIVQAHKNAPYEYYSAVYFLQKSKEEWGYSDFQASSQYATQAKRQAEAGTLKAKEDPFGGSPVSAEKIAAVRAELAQNPNMEESTVQYNTVTPPIPSASPEPSKKKKPAPKSKGDDPMSIMDDVNGLSDEQ